MEKYCCDSTKPIALLQLGDLFFYNYLQLIAYSSRLRTSHPSNYKKVKSRLVTPRNLLSRLLFWGIRTLLPVMAFFSVACLTSFLPFVPLYFSSVSAPCSYPSCRLCLPLCKSFPVINQLLAAKGATVSYGFSYLHWLFGHKLALK